MSKQFYLSFYDYHDSTRDGGPRSFYGRLAALVRDADTDNLERLSQAFPGFVEMFRKRYEAPGGRLPTD